MAKDAAARGGMLANATAVVALAVGVERLLERVADIAHIWRTGEGSRISTDALWCALTSLTHAVGFDGLCAPGVPAKWEEIVVVAVVCTVAVVLLLAAWAALSRGWPDAERGAPPELGTLTFLRPALLHGGWLVLFAYVDRASDAYFTAHWLCSWSWWGTGVFAFARLVEAARYAGGYRAAAAVPPVLALYASATGFLLATNIAFFCVTQLHALAIFLHSVSVVYMAAAYVLDERHRPPLQRAALQHAALVAGAVPLYIYIVYAHLFDYRDMYASFTESENVTDWYPLLVIHAACSFATTIVLSGYAADAPACAGWHPRALAAAANHHVPRLAALAIVAVAVVAAMVAYDPEHMYHARNCPAAAVPLATYNSTAGGHFAADRAAWHTLVGDLQEPIYMHAIAAADPSIVAVELEQLEQHLLHPKLRALCRGRLQVPAEAADGRHVWAWALSLRRASSTFQTRIISPYRNDYRSGSMLLLVGAAPRGMLHAPSVAALTAYADSVTVHVPGVPSDTAVAAHTLSFLERAAAARERWANTRACEPMLATLERPLDLPSAPASVKQLGSGARPTLGRVALVASTVRDQQSTYHLASAVAPAVAEDAGLRQRWEVLDANVGLYSWGGSDDFDLATLGLRAFETADPAVPWVAQHVAGPLAAARLRETGRWASADAVLDDLSCFWEQSEF